MRTYTHINRDTSIHNKTYLLADPNITDHDSNIHTYARECLLHALSTQVIEIRTLIICKENIMFRRRYQLWAQGREVEHVR